MVASDEDHLGVRSLARLDEGVEALPAVCGNAVERVDDVAGDDDGVGVEP